MVYVIGGAPRCGKTKLGTMIAKKLRVPLISTDTLRKDAVKSANKEMIKKCYPFEEMFQGDRVDEVFFNYTGCDMLGADLIEAKALWPSIRQLLENKIDSDEDIIFEGVHLLPQYISKLSDSRQVSVIYLVKLDVEKILAGLSLNTDKNDWILGHIKKESTLPKAARMVSVYGKYFKDEAQKYDFRFLNTENRFYDKLDDGLISLLQMYRTPMGTMI